MKTDSGKTKAKKKIIKKKIVLELFQLRINKRPYTLFRRLLPEK